MLRARMPGVSNVKLNGTMPSGRPAILREFQAGVAGHRCGQRTEAAVSVPKAKSAEPSQSDTPAPLGVT
jgi:hypothetical protein